MKNKQFELQQLMIYRLIFKMAYDECKPISFGIDFRNKILEKCKKIGRLDDKKFTHFVKLYNDGEFSDKFGNIL